MDSGDVFHPRLLRLDVLRPLALSLRLDGPNHGGPDQTAVGSESGTRTHEMSAKSDTLLCRTLDQVPKVCLVGETLFHVGTD